MRILLDTNVLLRLVDEGRESHAEAVAAVDWLSANGYEAVLVPQVLYEYWVVATRPVENNGLGMTPRQVDLAISEWLLLFRLLQDERGVFNLWRDLVTQHDVKGKAAHDTRLIAALQRHAADCRLATARDEPPADVQPSGLRAVHRIHGRYAE